MCTSRRALNFGSERLDEWMFHLLRWGKGGMHFVGGINCGWGEINGSVLGRVNFEMCIRCANEDEGVFSM